MSQNSMRILKVATFTAIAAILTACVSTSVAPKPVTLPDLTFDSGSAVTINATNIVLVEDYRPPLKHPNVEHEFPVLPVQVIRNWTKERLQAAGAEGLFTVTVKEASVVESELPTSQGFKGRFLVEEDRKLSAKLVVGITYQGPLGAKTADFEVTAMKTLLESASLHDRERAYYWLIERLKQQTQAVMEDQIATTFADVVG